MPPWHLHVEVWALAAALLVGYWYLVEGRGPVSPRQRTMWWLGVAALLAGSAWPVHDLSEHYLLSVHMTQHLLFTFVAPPLLVAGTPGWFMRRALGPLLPVVRRLAHPLFAGVAFNAFIVFSHWPVVVDAALRSEALHFAVHVVLFGTATLMWLPVLSPIPEIRRLSEPGRMVYLFLQSVVPTVPASFLTFAESPIYAAYARAPRIWGLSAVEDQQLAGAIMKLGGGAILWGTIAVIFFRWYQWQERVDAERRTADREARETREAHAAEQVLTWDEVERELTRTEAEAPRER